MEKNQEIAMIVQPLQHQIKPYRLKGYAVNYIRDCYRSGGYVQIITGWCASRRLVERQEKQNGFKLLPEERKVLEDLSWTNNLFSRAGLRVNHFIFLVGSAVELGKISESVSAAYQSMLEQAVGQCGLDALVMLRATAPPDPAVLDNPACITQSTAYSMEVERRLDMYGKSIDLAQAQHDALVSIASKAQDARSLVADFGDFLLIPIQFIKRFEFHNLGVGDFTDRLLPVTKHLYPWRLPADS